MVGGFEVGGGGGEEAAGLARGDPCLAAAADAREGRGVGCGAAAAAAVAHRAEGAVQRVGKGVVVDVLRGGELDLSVDHGRVGHRGLEDERVAAGGVGLLEVGARATADVARGVRGHAPRRAHFLIAREGAQVGAAAGGRGRAEAAGGVRLREGDGLGRGGVGAVDGVRIAEGAGGEEVRRRGVADVEIECGCMHAWTFRHCWGGRGGGGELAVVVRLGRV